MYLKSFELSGFKSFAKKISLSFDAPITAVVGPNGSGKSNIVEAFRFVLGEQSLKSMRGKRGEDMIWNGGSPGSGGVSRANRASAKIVFDNKKRLFNLDFEEVTIERVVYRDSLSEYLINGSQVRLKDIIELLANAHIGASGHHIISQGEADHILIANPRERREMIEDALGLKIYQYKKRESARKLEKTEENIGQAESLRKEIAPHLKFLKKQVEKIEKTLELKEELKRLYREYLRREELYLEEETRKIAKERKEPEERLKVLEKELNEAKRTLAESPGLDKKRTELLAIESKLNDARNKREEKYRQAGKLEGELASVNRICEKIERETKRAEDIPVPLSKVKSLGELLSKEISTAESTENLSAIRQVLIKIKQIVKEFIEGNQNGENKDLVFYQTEIKDLSAKKKILDEEILKLREEEDAVYHQYNEIKESVEAEKDRSRDAEKRMFQLMAEQKETYAALSIIKDKETKLVLLKDEMEREIREGAMLIGREIFNFAKENFILTSGAEVSNEEIVAEPRKNQEERLRIIQKNKVRIEDAGAGGGDDVLKEYKDVSERDSFLEKELTDLENTANSLKQLIDELNQKLTDEFKIGVEKINAQFEAFFVLMFGGGKASIKVVEETKQKNNIGGEDGEILDLVSEISEESEKLEVGIDIDVKLPRKNIKGLEMLSGGERALTSIALLFAISQVNPPPFIVLDETDAALDEANSKKYGNMIENLSKLSQLILITHNRETMSRAGVLYGVTMGSDGVSKLLSVAFEEAVQVAK